MVIVRIGKYSLDFRHHGSVFEEDDIESITCFLQILKVHALYFQSQRVKRVRSIQLIFYYKFLYLPGLVDFYIVEFHCFDKAIKFLHPWKSNLQVEAVVFANGVEDQVVVANILDGAFDLAHFNVVLDFSLSGESDNFIFDFTLVVILIFFF